MDMVGLKGGKVQEIFKSLPRPKQTKNMLTNGVDKTVSTALKFKCVKPLEGVSEKRICNFYALHASHAFHDGVIRIHMQVETRVQMSAVPRVLYQPYEALIQRNRYPTIRDNTAGTREKDRGPTHTGDVAAGESLKGIHESGPSKGQSNQRHGLLRNDRT